MAAGVAATDADVVGFLDADGATDNTALLEGLRRLALGAHVAVVDVDKDNGHIVLRRYVAGDDCGPQINPMIVEGQVHGGVVQGAGQTLWEGVVYDDNGQREVTVEGLHDERMAELNEMYEAVTQDRPVRHDGRWGMATLEVQLALMESARERREIILSRQVPVPAHTTAV